MNNRLNIQDLAGLLSGRTGKDKDEIERFLREFISVVSEGIYADKYVKVKGLGVFKIIPVEERKSIQVDTGERFLIPAHYKFLFLPDKDLREQVNRPFSIFETTEINGHVDFSDMDVSVEEEGTETEDESVEEVIPEVMPEVMPEPSPMQEMPEGRPARKPRRIMMVSMMALFLILVALVFCNLGRFNRKPAPVGEEMKAETRDMPQVLDRKPHPDSVAEEASRTLPYVKPEPKALGRVKIKRGDRLTAIALEYYGNKLFWVYIYLHNKAVINDPNNVPIGTLIEIPAPESYGIDAKRRESREKAAALQTEILTKGQE